jgi:hypothetical protein
MLLAYAHVYVWGAALLLSLPLLPRVAGSLKVGGFSSPNTEAAQAREVLQRELGFAPSTLLVVYQSDGLPADDPSSKPRSIGRVPDPVATECHGIFSGPIQVDSRRRYRVRRRRLAEGPEEAQRLARISVALLPQDECGYRSPGRSPRPRP